MITSVTYALCPKCGTERFFVLEIDSDVDGTVIVHQCIACDRQWRLNELKGLNSLQELPF